MVVSNVIKKAVRLEYGGSRQNTVNKSDIAVADVMTSTVTSWRSVGVHNSNLQVNKVVRWNESVCECESGRVSS